MTDKKPASEEQKPLRFWIDKANDEAPPWAVGVGVRETGLLEYRCEHGVGHPVPESAEYNDRIRKHKPGTWSVHGCDGCCTPPAPEKVVVEQFGQGSTLEPDKATTKNYGRAHPQSPPAPAKAERCPIHLSVECPEDCITRALPPAQKTGRSEECTCGLAPGKPVPSVKVEHCPVHGPKDAGRRWVLHDTHTQSEYLCRHPYCLNPSNPVADNTLVLVPEADLLAAEKRAEEAEAELTEWERYNQLAPNMCRIDHDIIMHSGNNCPVCDLMAERDAARRTVERYQRVLIGIRDADYRGNRCSCSYAAAAAIAPCESEAKQSIDAGKGEK